jgi:hypothetical protein
MSFGLKSNIKISRNGDFINNMSFRIGLPIPIKYYYEEEKVIMVQRLWRWRQLRKSLTMCNDINEFVTKKYYVSESRVIPYNNPLNTQYENIIYWCNNPKLFNYFVQ